MLDFLTIAIPFDASHVLGDDEGHTWLGCDLLEMGMDLAARSVFLNTDGTISHQVLYHPYETLPSSFTGMAFKIYDKGLGKSAPFVEIKASPAKLMQGHNVFGSESILLGSNEMITILQRSYPTLFSMLYIQGAEVRALDTTYSAKLKNAREAQNVLDYIRNISNGQTRKNHKSYQTTAYWGGDCSRLKQVKLYIKQDEFNAQLDDMKKRAAKQDLSAARCAAVMSDSRIQSWLTGLIRWEARLKSRWFERRGISFKLVDLIDYQKANPDCLQAWWQDATKDIFTALEGMTMTNLDDDSVFEQIRQKFTTVTAKGRVSHTRANNLFNFYCALREHGCTHLKSRFSETRFYANLADLISCGFSKAYLQNLHDGRKNNIVPLLRFVQVDFSSQRPEWYQEPVSQFLNKVA